MSCPSDFTGGCVLQGDIITVEYTDNYDASGKSQTVTDSATFDLRNGVLTNRQIRLLNWFRHDLNLN